jgi:hypothetical protein
VPPNVARHFAAARGVAYVDGVLQIEFLHQGRQIVGVSVHVVAIPGLAGTAVAAAIVRDAPKSAWHQKIHLIFESVGRERPAMAENYRLSGAPILVIDLGAVFGGKRGHVMSSSPELYRIGGKRTSLDRRVFA